MNKYALFTMMLLLLAIIALGCAAPTAPPPQVVKEVVKETVIVAGTPVVKEVQKVVTPTAAPISFKAPRPDTITYVTIGDIDTMDPNLAYDTASATLIQNVLETLIYFNKTDPTSYVPILATEVPSVANGGISADGKTYTFKIRKGVKFSNGNDLTPSDFEYTFERGMLQSDPNGPQWLLLEPLIKPGLSDIAELIEDGKYSGDPAKLKANAKPDDLKKVCEQVKAAVVADDTNFTLTFKLAQPWGPFLATLAQTWGAALDKEWAIQQGAWNGSCDTWVNHYAPGAEKTELGKKIMGTGPYKLDHWTPDQEWVLVANENYWRKAGDPIWKDGPSGPPRVKRIVYKLVNEWGTRFATLQAGDAEAVAVPPANRPQVDDFVGEICDYKTGQCKPDPKHPNAPLRKWGGLPTVSRTDIFLNFKVKTDASGQNPYIGSGKLDGNGIPPDFFSDIHVRKAFNYCMDYDTYIKDALNGEGVRNNGPIILDMLGYNPKGEMYPFDLKKCEEELKLAWGGKLPTTGFRMQIAFNTGNVTRQTVAAILQTNLAKVNPKYNIEIIGLPWPTFLRLFRAGQLPVIVSGWIEDIHDPHNWAQPFTVGTYAGRQNLPADLVAQFKKFVDAGVAESDPKKREAIYFDLQKLHHDQAIQVTLAQATDVRYEQRWFKDWFYNPIMFGGYFYAYDLAR